jgi:hypothetical protein
MLALEVDTECRLADSGNFGERHGAESLSFKGKVVILSTPNTQWTIRYDIPHSEHNLAPPKVRRHQQRD